MKRGRLNIIDIPQLDGKRIKGGGFGRRPGWPFFSPAHPEVVKIWPSWANPTPYYEYITLLYTIYILHIHLHRLGDRHRAVQIQTPEKSLGPLGSLSHPPLSAHSPCTRPRPPSQSRLIIINSSFPGCMPGNPDPVVSSRCSSRRLPPPPSPPLPRPTVARLTPRSTS